MYYVKEIFKRIKSITGYTAVDATADSITVNGENITIRNIAGNLWLNPNATAVANSSALLLTTGMTLDLCVNGTLSIISDGSGATYQIIVWEV